MVYVKRNGDGAIVAVSRENMEGFAETLPEDQPELQRYLREVEPVSELAKTDLEFVRVLEDVVDLLMAKGVMLFTELPPQAQAKILARQSLRRDADSLDLLDEDLPL